MARERYRIGNWKIPYRLETADMSRVAFYAENPRIYSRFAASEERTQKNIGEKLQKMEHVKSLRALIDRDGQVNEPLWCMEVGKEDELYGSYDYVALEGNSRLAALKMEKSTPPVTSEVPCNVLDLSRLSKAERESFIFSLLGRIHITGRADWQTYENAAYIYRRFKNQGVPATELAKDLAGISPRKVRNTVKAYELMLKNEDSRPGNWSYYEVLVSSNKVRKAREEYSELDDIVLPMIKRGEFPKAQSLRDELPVIMSDKRARKRFLGEDAEDRFGEALELAEATGGSNYTLRKLKQFHRFVAEENTEREIESLLNNDGTTKVTAFALDKIYDMVARLSPKAQRRRSSSRSR
ncbi:MAG: hypothetical protein OXG13_01205 [Gemmatimonadaceae bacterium]|nr:hypothetical protein [Gemmatimonadaceae bacterium]